METREKRIISDRGYWEAKYYKAKLELINANRGIARLVKGKKKAYEHGWVKGLQDAKGCITSAASTIMEAECANRKD